MTENPASGEAHTEKLQATRSNTRRMQILAGLLLALVVPNLPLDKWGLPFRIFGPLLGREVLWWALAAVLLLYGALIERKPLSTIGFRRFGIRGILAAIGAGILMVAGIAVIYGVVFRALHLQMNTAEMHSLLATPLWYRFMLVTRAAVVEETLFRGYAIERLTELTGSVAVAGLVSLAAFTLAHVNSWGWAQLIVAGFGGVVLTILYLWRRNVCVNMIAHWIADGAGFLLPR